MERWKQKISERERGRNNKRYQRKQTEKYNKEMRHQ